MQNQKYKYTAKDWVKVILVFVAFGLITFLILKVMSVPTPVATDAQVWDVLVANGYEPQDLTQKRLDKEPNCGIIKNITGEQEDIHFEFNVFDSEKTARHVYARYRLLIREKEINPDMGYSMGRGNYSIYTADNTYDNRYYALVVVGNTVVFAASYNENQNSIYQILNSIGYMNPSQLGKAISKTSMSLIAIAMYLIVLRTLTSISLDWIWSLICKRAGLTKQEVRLRRKENGWKFSFESSSYYYILQKTKKPKQFKAMYFGYKACFIPVWMAILIEFLSLFLNSPILNSGPFAMAGIGVMLIGGLGRLIYNRIYLPKNEGV